METNNNESGIPRRRALGRGLEELFNSESLDYSTVEERIVNETPKDEITLIPLSELRSNPYQPRKVFDETALEELASSIKEHGVFQPIIVKKSIKGYEIIAGERRVKASLMAGKTEIPAIIRDFNDTQMMEIALLENLQRENLTAIEEATAYKKLQETLSLTQEELAKRLGKSRSHITNMLGLLTLPRPIQEDITSKKISMGHARILSKLENSNHSQIEIGDRVQIIGNYASSSRSLCAIHSYKKGSICYITNIYPNRKYPYQLGTKQGNTSSKYTIGFIDKKGIIKL